MSRDSYDDVADNFNELERRLAKIEDRSVYNKPGPMHPDFQRLQEDHAELHDVVKAQQVQLKRLWQAVEALM